MLPHQSLRSPLPRDLALPGHHHRDGRHLLLLLVLFTSASSIVRRMSYEWWYAVHLTAYAGIALAWFHMIPDGNDVHVIVWARRRTGRAIYIAAVVARRLVSPAPPRSRARSASI